MKISLKNNCKIPLFASIFLCVGISASSALAIETAQFTLLKEKEDFSVRAYEPMVLVSVEMENAKENRKKSSNTSFMKLFRYISKNNEKEQKIAMTTPVLRDMGNEGNEKMYFVMPAAHVEEGSPAPKDKDLKVTKKGQAFFAAYSYKGKQTPEKNQTYKETLTEWITEEEMVAVGDPFFASYNGPMTPSMLRKHDILIELKKTDALEKMFKEVKAENSAESEKKTTEEKALETAKETKE